MTKDEVYEYYLHWRKGSRTLSVEELFSAYTIDQNIFESSSKVINRLFYLVPDFFKSNLRIFIFYEENTFLKDSKHRCTRGTNSFDRLRMISIAFRSVIITI